MGKSAGSKAGGGGGGGGAGKPVSGGGVSAAATSQTTSGGTSALSAEEAAKSQGMRNIIAQKGAAAKQAAEQKLTQLERQVASTKEHLTDMRRNINIPGMKKQAPYLARDIAEAKKEIPQMESMIRIIKDALK